jgi:peptide/nickel transport system ATP-binding protein
MSSAAIMSSAAPPRPLLQIRDLNVEFGDGRGGWLRVLHGVSLDLRAGECIGMVGESGCGKSVTWLAVTKLLGAKSRSSGSVLLDGEEIAGHSQQQMTGVRGKRIGMIFQDPASSLNPVLTIGRQMTESLRRHRGMDALAARAEACRLLERTGIPAAKQRLDQYPHELSGGMNQRVMIAMTLAPEPEILVADEPTTALDATVQAQILQLLHDLKDQSGMALVIVSHDLGVVSDIADRIHVMYAGRIVEQSSAANLFAAPRHPYTRGLLAAIPRMDSCHRLQSIPGTVAPAWLHASACSFAERCSLATQICRTQAPEMFDAVHGQFGAHSVRCHHADWALTLPLSDAAE